VIPRLELDRADPKLINAYLAGLILLELALIAYVVTLTVTAA
jgi:hypothetical protein